MSSMSHRTMLEMMLNDSMELSPGRVMETMRQVAKDKLSLPIGPELRCPHDCRYRKGNFICKAFSEAIGPGIPPLKCSSCLFVTVNEPGRVLIDGNCK